MYKNNVICNFINKNKTINVFEIRWNNNLGFYSKIKYNMYMNTDTQ